MTRNQLSHLSWLLATALAAVSARAADDPPKGADGASKAADGASKGADEIWTALHVKKVYPVAAAAIDNGWILMRDDKIEAVGANIDLPPSTEAIEAPELVAIPGLLNPMTRFGLPQGYQRSGTKAHLHVSGELSFDQDDLHDFLKAGFTTLGFTPAGNGLPGQGTAVLTTSAAIRAETTYLTVSMRNPASDKRMLKEALESAKREIEKVEKAKKDFEEQQKKKAEEAKKKADEDAKKPQPEKKPEPPPQPKPEDKKPPEEKKPDEKKPDEKKPEEAKSEEFVAPKINPTLQPLVDLLQKKENVQLLIQIDGAADYVQLLDLLKDYDIAYTLQLENTRRTRFGFGQTGHDFHFLLDRLPEKKPLMVFRANLNWRDFSRNWVNYPESFRKAGCDVAMMPRTDEVREHESFLLDVNDIIKAGMPADDALKAITLNAARALGMSASLGSLEKGKDADIVLLNGEPFDVFTRVERVFVKAKLEYDRSKDEAKGRE